MESKADTRLVMISSLRAMAEFQRSGPQPFVGTSQRFPSKAMVAWMEEGKRQRWPWAIGHGMPPLTRQAPGIPKATSTSQVGQIKSWPFLHLRVLHA